MLLTLAEALGTLADEGCRPRRSILVAHWDAEEYGIIGSTEWVEELRATVEARAVAYVNAALIGLEKAWLDERGLQDRPWSRSLYVSPDPLSGYASWMLPGIRYEIETGDPEDVPGWVDRYVGAVRRLTERMREATGLIDGA